MVEQVRPRNARIPIEIGTFTTRRRCTPRTCPAKLIEGSEMVLCYRPKLFHRKKDPTLKRPGTARTYLTILPVANKLDSLRLLNSGSYRRHSHMDKLDELFDLQAALNKRIGVSTDELSEEEKTQWILNYTRAMQQELSELVDSVPWKWWAKYQEFDEQNAKVEVIDLFHFLISLAQVLGMTAEDVHAIYTKKNKVNHDRQDSGYSKKDDDDARHI